MKRLALAAALAVCGFAAAAQDSVPPREIIRADHPGQQLFARNCAPCHGTGPGDDGSPMLPGTAALTAKYGGQRPGALELRSDLPAPVLALFVRRGVGAMPGFRPGELSDADIAAIASYLAATAEANASTAR
jgi:mono/diheme cytochrome c family protein